ncbi:uncharacterized protein [Haliotis cracherodii]|uniref:uncharacterized protein n=1 Tax=Haliotis cracherodii TaxID=6455 RepID=UPI0039EC7BBF
MYINKNDGLVKFDIHSAYHHIDIFPLHTQYLGFSWGTGPKITYYKFLVLPFGLTSAPYVFTKVTRQLVKYWRYKGYRIVTFLDDGILSSDSMANTTIIGNAVKQDLIKSGFVPKSEKSLWAPCQVMEWLGLIIDTKCMKLSITRRKVDKLHQSIIPLLKGSGIVPVRKVASVVGQVISMSLVVGSVAQLMTRALSMQTVSITSWNEFVLTQYSKHQLEFWLHEINKYTERIWCDQSIVTRVVYNDASSVGYGGYCVQFGEEQSHGQWSVEEAALSSTHRELKAVYMVLQSFLPLLKSHRIKWFSDNKNVESNGLFGVYDLNFNMMSIRVRF